MSYAFRPTGPEDSTRRQTIPGSQPASGFPAISREKPFDAFICKGLLAGEGRRSVHGGRERAEQGTNRIGLGRGNRGRSIGFRRGGREGPGGRETQRRGEGLGGRRLGGQQ